MYSVFKLKNYTDNTSLSTSEIWLKRIDTIYFFSILFLAIYFGKERAIFCDGSNALYDIVTKKIIYYDSHRYAAAINYIFPLISTYFNCSMKVIVYSLAINYLILPVVCFAFLRYKSTTIRYELIFLITFSIFNWQTYYYPIHDYWSGFYVFFILYRIIDDTTFIINKKQYERIIAFLVSFILLCHINLVLPLGFLFFYLVVENKISKQQFFKYILFVLFIFILLAFVFSDGYQTGFLSIQNFIPSAIIQIFSSDLCRTFLPTLFHSNFNFLVLLFLFYLVAVFSKRWKLVIVFSVILISSFLILFLMFKEYEYTVYAEGQFKSVTMVLPILFVNLFLDTFRTTWKLILVFVINFIFSFCVLFSGGKIFEKHYNFVNETCLKFKKNVFLLSKRDICPLEFIVLPKHSLIINQIENKANTCLFANVNNESIVTILDSINMQNNKLQQKSLFTYPTDITYLNADSMDIDVAKLNLVFPDKCIGHYKRIVRNKN